MFRDDNLHAVAGEAEGLRVDGGLFGPALLGELGLRELGGSG